MSTAKLERYTGISFAVLIARRLFEVCTLLKPNCSTAHALLPKRSNMGVGCACTTSDTHRFKTEVLTLSAFVRARSLSHCCARNAFVCCWMLLLVALRALSAALELWCDNTASHAESVARASCGCIASTNFSNCALAFHPISDCLLTIIHTGLRNGLTSSTRREIWGHG